MDEESRQYTAFAIPGSGLWQFKRMPFGLTNAPATFQRLIGALFGPKMEPNVFGYLDDIIIATDTFEEHQKWLEIVLTKIRDAQLTVNWKKCEVSESEISGVLVGSRRVEARHGEGQANFGVPRS